MNVIKYSHQKTQRFPTDYDTNVCNAKYGDLQPCLSFCLWQTALRSTNIYFERCALCTKFVMIYIT